MHCLLQATVAILNVLWIALFLTPQPFSEFERTDSTDEEEMFCFPPPPVEIPSNKTNNTKTTFPAHPATAPGSEPTIMDSDNLGLTGSRPELEPTTQGSYPEVEPTTQGSYPEVEPTTQGSYPELEPTTQGSYPEVEPTTQGSYPGVEPTTQGSYPEVEPTTQGSYPEVEPTTQGSYPELEPTTQGSYPELEPTTQGSYPEVEPTTQGSYPEVEPTTQGSYPEVEPTTQGSYPEVEPTTQGSYPEVEPTTQGSFPEVEPTPVSCCFEFYNRQVPINHIKGYRKSHPTCPVEAIIIFTTTTFCVDPNAAWVRRILITLDENGRRVNPDDSHSTPAPESKSATMNWVELGLTTQGHPPELKLMTPTSPPKLALTWRRMSSDDCCFSFYPRRLNKNLITSYQKTDSRCTKTGIILITKSGRHICVDPNVSWVKGIMMSLDKRTT